MKTKDSVGNKYPFKRQMFRPSRIFEAHQAFCKIANKGHTL